MVGGLGVPLRHQRITAALADGLADFGLRILDVAEQPRTGRAGLDAGRLAVLRRQQLVVDAVDAKRALGHHLPRFVDLARAVGGRPRRITCSRCTCRHSPARCFLYSAIHSSQAANKAVGRGCGAVCTAPVPPVLARFRPRPLEHNPPEVAVRGGPFALFLSLLSAAARHAGHGQHETAHPGPGAGASGPACAGRLTAAAAGPQAATAYALRGLPPRKEHPEQTVSSNQLQLSAAGITRSRPPALGQSSVGRVGQSSIGADTQEKTEALGAVRRASPRLGV